MELQHPEQFDALPIFPLATVLFPGAILPLHIFEERYKEMMRYAVQNGALFGLSYVPDAAASRETPPGIDTVGCLAKISAVMPLEEGRMNVVSLGIIRYRVKRFSQLSPFLIAVVDGISDAPELDADLTRLDEDVRELYKEFLVMADSLGELPAAASKDFPEDAEGLSLIAASLLPIDNNAKQALLEMTSTRLRLTKVRHVLLEILPDFAQRIKIKDRAKTNGHGRLA